MRAAEPRYVLQSPELVGNCVGLYVPLLEFNRLLTEVKPTGDVFRTQSLSEQVQHPHFAITQAIDRRSFLATDPVQGIGGRCFFAFFR